MCHDLYVRCLTPRAVRADCDFTVSVVHEPPEADGPEAAGAGGKAPKAAAAKAGGRSGAAAAAGAPAAPQQAAASFPDPFGVDRARLRLRAGAGDKLRGAYLPFALGGTRATLVFRDAECGEFCYELRGEAGLPAACLEHKAVISQDGGTQARAVARAEHVYCSRSPAAPPGTRRG